MPSNFWLRINILSRDLKLKEFDKVFIFNSSLRYLLISKIAGIKNISQYPLFRKKDNVVTSAKIFTENELGDIVSTQPELIISGDKVNKAKQLTQLFVKKDNGFDVVAPEGFVAIDNNLGGAVKLVDRMEFSLNNFTVQKDWDK